MKPKLTFGSHPGINISFVITESKEKPTFWKRRQENMMMGHLSELLRKISKHHTVELVGCDVTIDVIKIIICDLDISDKDQFLKCVPEILEKHSRQRKTLKFICDELFDIVFSKNAEIIILYSLIDNFYKTLL